MRRILNGESATYAENKRCADQRAAQGISGGEQSRACLEGQGKTLAPKVRSERSAETDHDRCSRGALRGCNQLFGLAFASQPRVDHCHATGQIRGILCNNCNRAAGLACDNPKILRALARYLEKAARPIEC